jgi:hypothetical protein
MPVLIDDPVESLVRDLVDGEDLRGAAELAEFEDRGAALVDELGEILGCAVGLLAQVVQALDELALEVVVLQQGDVAIEAGRRAEGLGEIAERAVPADRSEGAVLVGLGAVGG